MYHSKFIRTNSFFLCSFSFFKRMFCGFVCVLLLLLFFALLFLCRCLSLLLCYTMAMSENMTWNGRQPGLGLADNKFSSFRSHIHTSWKSLQIIHRPGTLVGCSKGIGLWVISLKEGWIYFIFERSEIFVTTWRQMKRQMAEAFLETPSFYPGIAKA